jgi:predicted DNA-binding protein (MmcQ/YjbR family)
VAAKPDRTKWHPYFAALYDHAAAKPGAELTQPWGHSVFGVAGKNFVWMGNPDQPGLTVKPYPGSRDVLVSSGKASVAQYIGRFGWVDFHVNNREQLAVALDLIDESYEHVIPKRKRDAAAAAADPGAAQKTAPPKKAAKRAAKKAPKKVAKKAAKKVAKQSRR